VSIRWLMHKVRQAKCWNFSTKIPNPPPRLNLNGTATGTGDLKL
jgi:hypothetical protein